MQAANRLLNLQPYAFAEVDKLVEDLRKKGIKPIDFGVGDPMDPTPIHILHAEQKALEQYKSSGYPSYIGLKNFRETIAKWMKQRFNVQLNPENEITSTIGGKEGIFHFPFGFVNPGDYVLMPSPGYPPYKTGTLFAGGIPYFTPLLEENDFYPDLTTIPKNVLKKTKILWLNYPNSPTGKTATPKFYKTVIKFAQKWNLIIASDECYSEIYFDKKPHSILEFGHKNIVVFQSLSKRSRMTGHRVGWVCGDGEVIKIFKKVKTNIDSGTPNFIQEGAIAALLDEKHVEEAKKQYREKRNIMLDALKSIGLKTATPEATFYIWQKVPKAETSISFAKKLLQNCAIVVTPGKWIADPTSHGRSPINPGKNYIRFALVPTLQEVKEAAKRLTNTPSLLKVPQAK